MSFNCVTEQGSISTDAHSNHNTQHLSYLVQPRLHGKRQRLPSLKVLWMNIFSYSGPTESETLLFRCLCKLFSKALKPPCWTSLPHPKYSTIGKLFDRLNALSNGGSMNIPTLLLLPSYYGDLLNNGARFRIHRI